MEHLKSLIGSLSEIEKDTLLRWGDEDADPETYPTISLTKKGLIDEGCRDLNSFGLVIRDILLYQSDLKGIQELYYLALIYHTKRYKEMLVSRDHEKNGAVISFCDELIDSCQKELPLFKLNRWFGYIQREVTQLGYTTVEAERNTTRSYFRPLDFSDIFYSELF